VAKDTVSTGAIETRAAASLAATRTLESVLAISIISLLKARMQRAAHRRRFSPIERKCGCRHAAKRSEERLASFARPYARSIAAPRTAGWI